MNNGDVFWNETQYQDSAQLRCNDGYGHSGHSITMCQANGTWFPPLGPCILQGKYVHVATQCPINDHKKYLNIHAYSFYRPTLHLSPLAHFILYDYHRRVSDSAIP